jgi:hypothetical protein
MALLSGAVERVSEIAAGLLRYPNAHVQPLRPILLRPFRIAQSQEQRRSMAKGLACGLPLGAGAPPKPAEAARVHLGVDVGVTDVAVAEVVLDSAGVGALVDEPVPAAVAHVLHRIDAQGLPCSEINKKERLEVFSRRSLRSARSSSPWRGCMVLLLPLRRRT